jgi:hypothetical protein
MLEFLQTHYYALGKAAIWFAAPLAFGIWQLVSVTRAQRADARRAAEAEADGAR